MANPGGNQILPFLALVLWLGFIKQVFNYLFVAIDKNNEILWVNSVGVVIGLAIGLVIIPKYAMVGGIVTQVLLEVLYVI
jgi:O-antigen/teichoic acid export membrane protein